MFISVPETDIDSSFEEFRQSSVARPASVSLFGVPVTGRPIRTGLFGRTNRFTRLTEGHMRSPERNAGLNFSVRVVKLRVLLRGGTRVRLHPISSIRCSKMLNRILGILFRSDSREVPTEVRSLFTIGKLPGGEEKCFGNP